MTLAGKPVSHYRLRRREIAWEPLIRRFPEKPPLFEWVLLSMLLHALAIILFGSPTGGTSEGRAMWGSLQVVLTGLPAESNPILKLDRGGIEAPKEQVAKPAPLPEPVPRPRLETTKPSLRAAPKIEPAAPPVEAPPLPEATPKVEPIVIPPVLERLVVPERQLEVPPPTFTIPPPTVDQTPVPVTAPSAPVPPPVAPAREAPAVKDAPVQPVPRLPQVERAPAEVPKVSTPLLQPVTPTVIQQRLTAPPELEMPRIESRTVPSIAAPPVITQPMESKPVAIPKLQELAPTPVITQPLEARPVPAPKLQELAPVPQIETIAKPVEAPPIREVPVAPPQVVAPAPTPTPSPAATPQVEPRIEPRIEPQPQQRESLPQGTQRQAPTQEAPSPRPVPAPAPGTPGVPDAPSQFRKRPEEPTGSYDPFSTPKDLDLDAIKRRAGQLARGTGNNALLAFPMPAVPPKKSKMEEAIENARKPDCRTAYAGLGLAAVVPLVANEFGEGTCRW
jgi:hypothetical protein